MRAHLGRVAHARRGQHLNRSALAAMPSSASAWRHLATPWVNARAPLATMNARAPLATNVAAAASCRRAFSTGPRDVQEARIAAENKFLRARGMQKSDHDGAVALYHEVLKDYAKLGDAYVGLGDYANARDVLERAVAIKERAYGRDHPTVALTLTKLGNAYGQLGDHAKAQDMLERALAIFERAYGRDHPSVAFPLANLGNLCLAYGVESATQVAKAREYFDRAHAIFERAYGPGHQVTQQVRAWLASVS